MIDKGKIEDEMEKGNRKLKESVGKRHCVKGRNAIREMRDAEGRMEAERMELRMSSNKGTLYE